MSADSVEERMQKVENRPCRLNQIGEKMLVKVQETEGEKENGEVVEVGVNRIGITKIPILENPNSIRKMVMASKRSLKQLDSKEEERRKETKARFNVITVASGVITKMSATPIRIEGNPEMMKHSWSKRSKMILDRCY